MRIGRESSGRASDGSGQGLTVGWVVSAVIIAFGGWFCWRVLQTGYVPDDDALRHAAKALSGKSWGEILVLRPEITIDHNPGWHWILRSVATVSGWNAHSLVVFSSNPAEAGLLPSPGGILYSVDMSIFYHTFFCNPTGGWRYALGFEPTFTTAPNRAVYEQLCLTRNAVRACEPWVRAMTPADRLFLQGPPQIRPAIRELIWSYVPPGLWIGRVPEAMGKPI